MHTCTSENIVVCREIRKQSLKEAEETLRDTGSREGDEVGVCDKEAEEELKGSSGVSS